MQILTPKKQFPGTKDISVKKYFLKRQFTLALTVGAYFKF